MLSIGRHLDLGQPVNRSAPLNRGLVSWWMPINQGPYFGGARLLDLCGKNHGTLGSGPTWGAPLRVGSRGSLVFAGTGFVTVPDANSLDISTEWTIALWYRRTAASVQCLGKYLPTGDQRSWRLDCSQYSTILFDQSVNGTLPLESAGATAENYIDTTYHVCVTKTAAGVIRIYKNAADGGGGTGYGNTFISTAPLEIGGTTSFGAATCNIDDVQIFNRALTPGEVLLRYQASLTGYRDELNWLSRQVVFDVGGGGPATLHNLALLGCGA